MTKNRSMTWRPTPRLRERGWSVGLSSDGNVAVVGNPEDDGGLGATRVIWLMNGSSVSSYIGFGNVGNTWIIQNAAAH
jgi:hypothetical protein